MAQLNFAVADVPMSDAGGKDFSPIPEGTYKAVIFDSEVKPTKTGGEMLVLTWEIKDGPHSGRRIWDRLNVKNKNPKAESIAKQDLAAICMAMGLNGVADSEELHWKDVSIKVVVRPPENGYDASNEIKGYAAPAGAATPPPAAPPASAPQSLAEAAATASAPAKKPWE
jgi:hypothetical protein